MYEGKEKCQGCGKSGAEYSRYEKNSLCSPCKKLLDAGKSLNHEQSTEYILIFQHYYAYHDAGKVDMPTLVHDILKALDNPTAKTDGGVKYIKQQFGSNGVYYKIDSRLFFPLQRLFLAVEKASITLRDQLENIPKTVREEISKERDSIYNEGIQKGRDLLGLLNQGKISLQALDNNYSYNTKNEKT